MQGEAPCAPQAAAWQLPLLFFSKRRKGRRCKIKRKALFALLLAALLALLFFADAAGAAVSAGLALCLHTVIPSLFPFFIVSSLLISLGFSERLGRLLDGFLRPLFRVGGAGSSALVLGLVGGYPIGARTAALLFEEGRLSQAEAARLLAFCNNCSPAFILNVLGLGVFGSTRIGVFLYLIHVAAALLTGICFRRYGKESPAARRFHRAAPAPPTLPAALVSSVQSSLRAMGSVCAFVVFFMLLLAPLRGIGGWAGRLLIGFFELFNGAALLPPTRAGFVAAAAMLGWGGLSVHCQTLAILAPTALSARSYLLGKALQSFFSFLLAVLLVPCLSL